MDDELARILSPLRTLMEALEANRNGLIETMRDDATIPPDLRERSETALAHLDAAAREVEAALAILAADS